MNNPFYQIGFGFYTTIFRIVALFHHKAGLMVRGQRETWKRLEEGIQPGERWLWFHASSLGEFEQGRPIMERIRIRHPEYRILVTFFSPSGYEVRKNYQGADLVCYLPFDTIRNVKRFLKLVQPEKAFFIKYEFWPNYLNALKKMDTPTYLISGIFRPSQLFFKPYAPFYRRLLGCFTNLFVQNQRSVDLLASIGYTHGVSVSGDTRFDRVLEIFRAAKQLPLVEQFVSGGQPVLVAGSSWPKDEAFLIPYFNEHSEWKMIVAPHLIDEDHLKSIEQLLQRPSVRFSMATPENVKDADCLIIDCFGLLSSIYRYGNLAYIGGGFGAGIHNTLEAAVYGIPVLFGPNHGKFHEAMELLQSGGGFSFENNDQFVALMQEMSNTEKRVQSGKSAGEMVQKGSGGTERILKTIPF